MVDKHGESDMHSSRILGNKSAGLPAEIELTQLDLNFRSTRNNWGHTYTKHPLS